MDIKPGMCGKVTVDPLVRVRKIGNEASNTDKMVAPVSLDGNTSIKDGVTT